MSDDEVIIITDSDDDVNVAPIAAQVPAAPAEGAVSAPATNDDASAPATNDDAKLATVKPEPDQGGKETPNIIPYPPKNPGGSAANPNPSTDAVPEEPKPAIASAAVAPPTIAKAPESPSTLPRYDSAPVANLSDTSALNRSVTKVEVKHEPAAVPVPGTKSSVAAAVPSTAMKTAEPSHVSQPLLAAPPANSTTLNAPRRVPSRSRAPPDHFEAGPAPPSFRTQQGTAPKELRRNTVTRTGLEPGFNTGDGAAADYAGQSSDPADGAGLEGVKEAIVLRPTMEQFKSMWAYLTSEEVQQAGLKTGIVKVVPPAEWTAPSSPAERMMAGVPMATRKQEVHKLVNGQGWKTEDYFADLNEYREQAVEGARGPVVVHYAADLDHSTVVPDPGLRTDNEEKLQAMWSLHSLAGLSGSFLQHLPQHISGVSVPWTYFGMVFSTFCWHNEDLWFPSINFLYEGDTKVWYGVPGSHASTVKQVIETHKAGRVSLTKVFGLHNLLPPKELLSADVPVYRAEQKAGEFVVTFPAAYHAGFSCGWNCAEAVNFAQDSWLPMGRDYEKIKRGKAPCLSIDELVIRTAHNFHSRRVAHDVKQLFEPNDDKMLDSKEYSLLQCIQPELKRMSVRLQSQLDQLEHQYSPKLRQTCAVQQRPMTNDQRCALVNAFGCVKCDRLCFLFVVQCNCVADMLQSRRSKEKNNVDLLTQEPYLCIECATSDSRDGCNCDPSEKTLFMRATPAQVEAVLEDGALWLTQQFDTDQRPLKAARCC